MLPLDEVYDILSFFVELSVYTVSHLHDIISLQNWDIIDPFSVAFIVVIKINFESQNSKNLVGLLDGNKLGILLGYTVGDVVGYFVGESLGLFVGVKDGVTVGSWVNDGDLLGDTVGVWDGDTVGDWDGELDGVIDGETVGEIVGVADGVFVGFLDGVLVGIIVGDLVGDILGFNDGAFVGAFVGDCVGGRTGDFVGANVGTFGVDANNTYKSKYINIENLINIPDPHAIVNWIFIPSAQPRPALTCSPFFTDNNWYVFDGNVVPWYWYGHDAPR